MAQEEKINQLLATNAAVGNINSKNVKWSCTHTTAQLNIWTTMDEFGFRLGHCTAYGYAKWRKE
ncbi:hypothetical protein BDEG_22582 [Batrachochytrium dendrobatidis JEL423]|uniref:Uncharacterized protein n=1 Tax=Batrachochytrium dendrobatidis (strain JEL423) TaxID=403673 RepID=A0A177WG54_BATDL|nr:hypothetical protein BDEG_22582 [Batrachochytrium dendrobatidis JEL423]